MNYTIFGDNSDIVYIESEDVIISDTQSALDLMMTVIHDKGSTKIILDKKTISEVFFRLSSGMAGDILQKFVNYRNQLAIVGDFSSYTSKSMKDFIYECNKGRDVFFVDSVEQAVEKLK